MHLQFISGKIIDPEPLFFEEKKGPDVIVDCEGALLAPGLIDLQVGPLLHSSPSKDKRCNDQT